MRSGGHLLGCSLERFLRITLCFLKCLIMEFKHVSVLLLLLLLLYIKNFLKLHFAFICLFSNILPLHLFCVVAQLEPTLHVCTTQLIVIIFFYKLLPTVGPPLLFPVFFQIMIFKHPISRKNWQVCVVIEWAGFKCLILSNCQGLLLLWNVSC